MNMKTILNAVMQRLKEQVSELRYISEDWGQLDYYETMPPVKFPCALISIDRVNYDAVAKDRRKASVSLVVRIADAPSVTGNAAAPESYRNRAFAIFDLLEEVGESLNGLSGDTFKRFSLESIYRENRQDFIREYSMTFETGFTLKEG